MYANEVIRIVLILYISSLGITFWGRFSKIKNRFAYVFVLRSINFSLFLLIVGRLCLSLLNRKDYLVFIAVYWIVFLIAMAIVVLFEFTKLLNSDSSMHAMKKAMMLTRSDYSATREELFPVLRSFKVNELNVNWGWVLFYVLVLSVLWFTVASLVVPSQAISFSAFG